MEYLSRITQFLQKLTNPYPTRDWYIMLAIAALTALILIAIAVYFFIGIQSGFIIGSSSETEIPTQSLSREKIKQTLEVYEQRRVNFEAGNYAVPDVSDPSR